MTSDVRKAPPPAASPVARPPGARLGSILALTTTIVGLLALVSGLTTPPRSGPFCRTACLGAPYTDAAAFVPRDYWWLYPQSLLVLLVLGLLVCIHQAAAATARVFSGIAVALGAVAAAALLVDYAVQLAVVQPSLLRGETAGLSLWSQYNPHGVFIALENLGYLLLGLALLALAAVFTGQSRLDRGLRWLFLAGGALTVAALPALAVGYRADLEYRYEVAAIGLTWVTLIAGGPLLTRWFRHPGTPPAAADLPGRSDANGAAPERLLDGTGPTPAASGPTPLQGR
jgi:hypothetical protein